MSRKQVIVRRRDDIIVKYEYLNIDTINGTATWEMINTEHDSIFTIIVEYIFLKRQIREGKYCIMYKDRQKIMNGDYIIIDIA